MQEKLSELAIWREGINAHLTASIALGETSPAGLMMPNQSLLMTGRCHALNNLPKMMHIARELCGGQICVTLNVATFESPETKPWMDKYYTINDHWVAEDRRKLLAFARDLLNSDYSGHRLIFRLLRSRHHLRNRLRSIAILIGMVCSVLCGMGRVFLTM